MGYEDDFLAYLERMIRDLDRKISRGQDRLRRSAEAKQQVTCSLALQLPRGMKVVNLYGFVVGIQQCW